MLRSICDSRWDRTIICLRMFVLFLFCYFAFFWVFLICPKSQVWFLVQILMAFVQCLFYLAALFKSIQNGCRHTELFYQLWVSPKATGEDVGIVVYLIWTYSVFGHLESSKCNFWAKLIVKIEFAVLFQFWCR